MAYYSGTASSITDLYTALMTHAVADGWTATSDASFTGSISGLTLTVTAISVGSIQVGGEVVGTGVTAGTRVTGMVSGTGGTGTYSLSIANTVSSTTLTQPARVLNKAGVFFRIGTTSSNLTCLGCETDLVGSPAPNYVSMGRIFEKSGQATREMTFPCNYYVFGFSQELYLVANYDVDSYQFVAFGKSSVPGMVNQGGWCGATLGVEGVTASGASANAPIWISATDGGQLANARTTSGALGWGNSQSGIDSARNCWVNHGLDGHGWTYNGSENDEPIGIGHAKPLIGIQPSEWNSEATLLPIRVYKARPSFKSSMILDLQNARLVRVDNLSAGDILTLGSDKWRVFPWYRKDISNRNGGGGVNHTGTFGWAIRYEGP